MKLQIISALGALALCLGCSQKPTQAQTSAVGSSPADEKEFLSAVAIGPCSATKIGTATYLTAAHCVRNSGWQKGQTLTVSRSTSGKTSVSFSGTVQSVVTHDSFDLGVLVFAKEDNLFPNAELAKGMRPAGQDVVMTGYGCTEMFVSEGKMYTSGDSGYLQKLPAKLSKTAPGGASWDSHLYVKAQFSQMMSDIQVHGPALCPGDSGGAVYVREGGVYKVWGVNSNFHPISLMSTFVRVDSQAKNNVAAWVRSQIPVAPRKK